jgi:LEA14-like dessication related protein
MTKISTGWVAALCAALLLGACAALALKDPPRVTVAGIEPLSSEGLETRMLLKLRVQNPNDLPIDYDGVYLRMEVNGKTFASGVSNEAGSVPRFGEAVVAVPLTVSMIDVATQLLKLFNREAPEQVEYALEGRLSSPQFGTTSFNTRGSLSLRDVAVPWKKPL